METAEENRGEGGIRNQLQPGAVRHDDSKLRVSTTIREHSDEYHGRHRLPDRKPLNHRSWVPQFRKHGNQQFRRQPGLSPGLCADLESRLAAGIAG